MRILIQAEQLFSINVKKSAMWDTQKSAGEFNGQKSVAFFSHAEMLYFNTLLCCFKIPGFATKLW